MKVLHLSAGNLYGGIESYLGTLARLRGLCPEMVPHFGLCFAGRLRDELVETGVPVHDLGAVRLSRIWTVMQARWRLKSILRQFGIQVAVTHGMWPHAVFAPAVRRAGVRLINAVHDSLDPLHRINRWAKRTAPDAVVANSRYTAKSVESVFPGVPTEVVYLPVLATKVDRDEARHQIRKVLGTAADAVVILQASRLEPWKGHGAHIEALGRLKDLPKWEAWFAGGPQKTGEAEYLAELKALAVRNGIADRVKFLGQRSDVSRLLAAADVYCQPNIGPEPFGIAFVEALLAGRPAISSDIGGAAEAVDESCGVTCPAGDVEAVAATLRRLIVDDALRSSLGASGPARASDLCDPARQLKFLASSFAYNRKARRPNAVVG